MGHAQEYPTNRLCRVLGVAASGYYGWRHSQGVAACEQGMARGQGPAECGCTQRPTGRRRTENEQLVAEMKRIDAEVNHTYGSPRMQAALGKRGFVCNHKRVERLMRVAGIRAVQRKRRRRPATTDSKHTLPIAPNHLNRDFCATAPNQKWATDITYIPTEEGWFYLAVVLDLFSRKVVGWAMDTNVATPLPLRALRMAVQARRPAPGLLHHSDRGSQYASAPYQTELRLHHCVPSMSRTANCWDNAVTESFFASLKAERLNDIRLATTAQARSEIFQYIEVFYNRQRLHSALGYHAPEEFERTHCHGD